MPRLPTVDWKTLKRIFELDGFTQEREKASHISMVKPGVHRPIIIPKYDEIGLDIIHSNMRTAGMSRDRFLELHARI